MHVQSMRNVKPGELHGSFLQHCTSSRPGCNSVGQRQSTRLHVFSTRLQVQSLRLETAPSVVETALRLVQAAVLLDEASR